MCEMKADSDGDGDRARELWERLQAIIERPAVTKTNKLAYIYIDK